MIELSNRTMHCKCGKAIQVWDKSIESVVCTYCLEGLKPLPDGYHDDIDAFVKQEAENKIQTTSGKRPDKKPAPSMMDKQENQMDMQQSNQSDMTEPPKIKRSTRGRKPTVGAKVLEFIKERKVATFEDILPVYSQARQKLGKLDTPEIEARNCRSTLYILNRNNQIKANENKTTFSSITTEG